MSEESHDRITEVRVRGMRALADVRLPLGGLTVLIGENGSGKSTLVEALVLLRRAAYPGSFIDDRLIPFHGGLDPLLRAGDKALHLGVHIEGDGPAIDYGFSLGRQGSTTIIAEERLDLSEPGQATRNVITRTGSTCRFFDRAAGQPVDLPTHPGELALQALLRSQGTAAQPDAQRVVDALDAGRAHVPFDVRPGWVVPPGEPAAMRLPTRLAVASEVDRLGGNLANCYHRLKNGSPGDVWERTLERVRAGLGSDVVNVHTPAVGPSQIELVVEFRGLSQRISALALSDGQLAYLAFVAMVALAELGEGPSFLAFDEPESHMHPELLVRVVWLLEQLAETCPVILCTHSDRLLDALSEPARSAVLCELDEARATRLYRPDPEALRRWLERYRGLGELRREGYAPHVFREPVRGGA